MPLRRVSDYFTAGDLQLCPSAHAEVGAFNQMVITRQKDFMGSAASIPNDVIRHTNHLDHQRAKQGGLLTGQAEVKQLHGSMQVPLDQSAHLINKIHQYRGLGQWNIQEVLDRF